MSMSQSTKRNRKRSKDPKKETTIARINDDVISKISTQSKRHERFELVKRDDANHHGTVARNSYLLREIKSLDDLVIDTSKRLGFKMGDLNLIHSSTHRCKHHLIDHKLVVKKLECLDQSIYNLKVHETNQHQKFSSHPNFVTLYS